MKSFARTIAKEEDVRYARMEERFFFLFFILFRYFLFDEEGEDEG